MPHHPQGLINRRVSVCVRVQTTIAWGPGAAPVVEDSTGFTPGPNPQSLCSGPDFMRQLTRLLPILTFYKLTCPFSSKSGKLGDSPDHWLYLQARREGCLRSHVRGTWQSWEQRAHRAKPGLLSSSQPLAPQNGSWESAAWLLVSAKLSHGVLTDLGDGGRGRI